MEITHLPEDNLFKTVVDGYTAYVTYIIRPETSPPAYRHLLLCCRLAAKTSGISRPPRKRLRRMQQLCSVIANEFS